MFLTVDSEVNKETIKMIEGIDGMNSAHFIKF